MEWTVIAALVIVGLIFLCMPVDLLASLLSIFSFDDYGIRRIRRFNNTTDSFGNFFLFLSVVLCTVYVLFPYYELIYGLWLAFTLLCTLSRATLSMRKKPRWKAIIVIAGLYAVGAMGFACSLGVFNERIFVYPIYKMANDIASHVTFDVWYFLKNVSFPYTVLQGILMLVPLFYLWNQFKYFRLENTYRGYNLFTFSFHVLALCAALYMASRYGFVFINAVFQVQYSSL